MRALRSLPLQLANICSLKLQALQRFTSTASAVEDLAAIQDGRLTDTLEKFITEATTGADGDKKKKKKVEEMLIVSEPKLGMSPSSKAGAAG